MCTCRRHPNGEGPVRDRGTVTSQSVDAAGLTLHYVEAGRGDPVLLLHGIPTSSFLWRAVMAPMAERRRVIALDLPGFGRSDKPLDASYSFTFYERVLEAFLEALKIRRTALVVHDFGGPVGLFWAVRHADRLTELALLNTLVYPETSWAVKLFVLASFTPILRELLSSPRGIAAAMRLGVQRKERMTADVIARYQEPFRDRPARRALLKASHGLHPKGMKEIADKLPGLQAPVRIIYGEADRILPDVAATMRRVQRDLPQARATALPHCGHFLQEDDPEQLGELLAEFLR
jgi:haloalkane dehalogenase